MDREPINVSPKQEIELYGITALTWEAAQALGWQFITNLGPGEYSYATTMSERGFNVKLGDPMTSEGPRARQMSEDPSVISLEPMGLYVLPKAEEISSTPKEAGRPVTRGTAKPSEKVPGAKLSPEAGRRLQANLAAINRSDTGPGSYR